ncbi:unnamed protein product [Acanthoscelides obtectus]|uniref:Uncharacterized protein n=1 Tax=Acanthoscelides obtectus TaxID=200917 RepID=A0A9P0LJQ1_ACAOB|nr:unnamed protein product [Acanthoscelides obtectus]CAK1627139.1 hypothetical protein AOBTE_LOCUS4336 [Acanthoscelides obtectus]
MDENKEVEIEQRWLSSDNDVVSLVESLSIKNATDISQTATSATRRDCATQTSDNATGPPVLYQGPSMPPSLPYGGYPPPHHYGGYPPWSTASDCAPFEYGPRYPAPGYGYPANPPIQPWMMQMPRSSMQFRSQYNPGMGPAYHQQAQYQTQGSCQHQYPPKASLRPPRFYPPRTLPSKPSSVDTSTPTITPCPPPSASDF